jgi:CheY-like chemotaxis protein
VTIRKVVELTFMEEDYELEATADGREAIEKLGQDSPDLVIADVHMPEVGGFDVARESKRKYPDVPVLLLVGTFEPFDPADVEACGADEFLKKPFDSQDLLQQVERLLQSEPVPETGGDEPEPASAEQSAEQSAEGEGSAAMQDAAPAAADEAEAETDRREDVAAVDTEGMELSDEIVERIARRVPELLSDQAVRDVAWEVIPDMAEIVIQDRLRELESEVED